MISVIVGLYCDEFSFAMEGHAGYNPGNDIVCSAASALGQALYGYLDNNRDKIASVKRMDMGKGEMHISVKGDASLLPAFETAIIGLMQIAKKYPEHVKVNFKN